MTPLFFRLDASPKMGLGHLRRCCVLARACREKEAVAHFFIRSEALDLSTQDFPMDAVIHEIPWNSTPEEDAAQTVALCHQNGIRAGVVDHYRVSEPAQKILNEGGLRWMQFGNRLHTHPLLGALVHDANPGATIEDYRGRIHGHEPEFLTGPGYALVAEDFVTERARLSLPDPQEITSILLTFGGGDDRGATLAALDWLEAAGYFGKRLLLTTSMNPQLPALKERAATTQEIELHVDNWHPAPLMAQCQLALCAGGTSLHELACLGVPPVIVCIADNQFFPAQSWHEAGMAINLGPSPEIQPQEAVRHLQRLLSLPEERMALARRCWQAQDGQGAARVAEALLRQVDQQ
ncbi:UDP-2,4-diacetamido-2,4,6-trideoxy-beta-L-altropyranose hydrolase [Prosthecobacter sp. SYSU 5D2]|uniref:UDP-2,4-diacetamido-2,4, 6-trideoxy-beta-L-altropyranose hydrolase n=1 Tax=Prosthecobacter sp. SYSU 5D2 TaxID=3134134 RepID=UPI0031FF366F